MVRFPTLKLVTLMAGLVMAGSATAESSPNTLTPTESHDGWVLLFDGKSLNGWVPRGTGSTETLEAAEDWKVENGAIVCGGTRSSWLSGDTSFSDYSLRLEFRGSEKVNSGVFIRSQKEGAPHRTGYEVQIWDYQPTGFNTGSLMGSLKVTSPEKILAGQWNRFEITANGERFVIVLNGKTVLDGHNLKHASGVVGFQCQRDNPIEFRNIKLRPIAK